MNETRIDELIDKIDEKLLELLKIINNDEGEVHYQIIKEILQLLVPDIKFDADEKNKKPDKEARVDCYYHCRNNARIIPFFIEFKKTTSAEFSKSVMLYHLYKLYKDHPNSEIASDVEEILRTLQLGQLKKESDGNYQNQDKDEVGQSKRYYYKLKEENEVKLSIVTDGFLWIVFNFRSEEESPISIDDIEGAFYIRNKEELTKLIDLLNQSIKFCQESPNPEVGLNY